VVHYDFLLYCTNIDLSVFSNAGDRKTGTNGRGSALGLSADNDGFEFSMSCVKNVLGVS
jgi:hypothetical protein